MFDVEIIAKEMAIAVKIAVEKAVGEAVKDFDIKIQEIDERLNRTFTDVSAFKKIFDEKETITKCELIPIIKELFDSIPKPVDGTSVTVDDVRPVLEEMVRNIEIPKPVDGTSVTVDDVRPVLEEMVRNIEIPKPDISHLEKKIDDAIMAIPKPVDGTSVTVDDVRPMLEEMVRNIPVPKDGVSPSPDEVAKALEPIFATWALGFERNASAVLERAVERIPKPKDGQDGRNALELKDFDVTFFEDQRSLTFSLKNDEIDIQKTVKIPYILDKGVYSENKDYEKHDGVTFAGGFWICQKDNPDGKPGMTDDWRLAVKRGRDGREVVKTEKKFQQVKLND